MARQITVNLDQSSTLEGQSGGVKLVPRAGVEPARPYGQRILSPLRGYSQHSTTRYQVVFTDVSVVKASYVSLGIGT
jgi:hypothetical protein